MLPFPQPKRGRYNSEQEILDAIDAKLEQVVRLRKSATSMASKGRKLQLKLEKETVHADAFELSLKREALHDRADRKNQKADKIEKGYLTYLKHKLAEFRTELLPDSGETDRSVPK